jgi:RNA polymerase sigma factor (sigma-70 family)
MNDWDLLQKWVEHGSHDAFQSLVERHLNLVYSLARRSVRSRSQAEEITQTVFIIFARKAATLSRHTVLAGWLYRTTRLVALEALRADHQQQSHREEFLEMEASEPNRLWEEVRPVLAEALDRIQTRDRNALVLRFFEERSLGEVGQTLGISEEAARKRVDRALEKLRGLLARRGIASTAALLSVMFSAHAVCAAPVGLAVSVTAAASGSLLAKSTLVLVKNTLQIMACTKLKAIAGVALLCLFCAAAGTHLAIRHLSRDAAVAEEIPGIGLALAANKQTGAPTVMIVVPGSAPARAGLVKGQIIQAIDDVPTKGMAIRECLRRIQAHRVVRLELLDPIRQVTTRIDYTHGGASDAMGGIGVALGRDNGGSKKIMAVVPGSAAELAGLSKGMIIQAIDNEPTAGISARECLNRIQGAPGTLVLLQVINPATRSTNITQLTRYRL